MAGPIKSRVLGTTMRSGRIASSVAPSRRWSVTASGCPSNPPHRGGARSTQPFLSKPPKRSGRPGAAVTALLIPTGNLGRRPSARPLDRALPGVVPLRPLAGRHRGRERALDRVALGHRVERPPPPGAEAGEIGGAEARRLDDHGPVRRRADPVGLELAEEG